MFSLFLHSRPWFGSTAQCPSSAIGRRLKQRSQIISVSVPQSTHQRSQWGWCVRHVVTVTELSFAAIYTTDIALLQKMLSRVPSAGFVNWNYDTTTGNHEAALCILRDSIISDRIASLRIFSTSNDLMISDASMWGNLSNLTVLELMDTPQADKIVSDILRSNSKLKELVLTSSTVLELNTVHALRNHSATLTTLCLMDMECHPEILDTVGECCHNLKTLQLGAYKSSGLLLQWPTEVGLLAIAKGCKQLEIFQVTGAPSVTEKVLLTLAAHCPALKSLECDGCGELTDAVLLALSEGCSMLRQLRCNAWAVTSADTVDAAQPLLSRLTTCPFYGVSGPSPVVVARAVGLMDALTYLTIYSVSPALIEALRGCSVPSYTGVALASHHAEAVEVDTFVSTVAEKGSKLTLLYLYRGCTLSEATLLSLPALCPGVEHLSTDFDVTESTVLALLHGWPLLRYLDVCQNESFTDAVLRAIAEHPHLVTLELTANTVVSEGTLLDVAHSFRYLAAPATFSTAAKQKIAEAVKAARRTEKR
jgi:hypothetical protein